MNVNSFLASGKQLASTLKSASTIVLLDSSFNPPNNAHAVIAKLCLQEYPSANLMLLLATGNAEKPSVSVEELQHRANMMELLATSLNKSFNNRVSVGLTTEPRFVDKAKAVKAEFPTAKLVFAVGFDTAVRLGMPVYYSPPTTDKVKEVLQQLFKVSDLFVLAREADGITKSPVIVDVEKQEAALKQNELFAPYASQIKVQMASTETRNVSSSAARQSADQLRQQTPAEVCDYALKNRLYFN